MRSGSLSRLGSTIYGVATAVSNQSAVTVYRISGPDSFRVIEDLTASKNHNLGLLPSSYKVVKIFEPLKEDLGSSKSRQLLDQALVLWFNKPKSYTGEDVVEIHTHGGLETAKAMANAFHKLSYLEYAEPVPSST